MRMSMSSPCPFWPSLEPCAKETPVHVSMSKPRTHPGGGFSPSGASKSSGCLTNALSRSSSAPAHTKPMIGETRSAVNVSPTLAQLTPSPKTWPGAMTLLARPTPMIAPMSECEELAGRPIYQVPRFQMMAEMQQREDHREPGRAANVEHQFHRQQRDHAIGDRARGGQHADKVPYARPHHRNPGFEGVRINDRGNGVGRVVKAVDALEAESQCHCQHQKETTAV